MQNSLTILENKETLTSLEVAEITGKEHYNILRDIKDEISKIGEERGQLIFEESYYTNNQNKQQPMYILTVDGVLQLGARYSAEVRFLLIQKVRELQQRNTPKSFKEALWVAYKQQEQIEALELENKVQSQQIAELQPKATYYDLILQNPSLLSVTQIAKDYGMSAKAFNQKLHELGIQFSQSGVWLLYQKYANLGYTQSKTQVYVKSDGSQGSKLHTYWTQKGRLFLYELLKKIEMLPIIEKDNKKNKERTIKNE